MKTPESKAAAAARIGAALGRRKRAELLGLLRPCFARTEPWLQAGKYAAAVMCDLRRRNGWRIAERSGDRTPDRTQRLLNRAVWDTFAAMGVVRRFAVAGLDAAMGLPAGLAFRTKGQLAIDILAEAVADGVRLDFACGDEVYGACTELREYMEDHDQAYVLRVPSSFRLILAGGITLTCKQAAARLGRRGWEVRSAGTGAKGQHWYAWAWLTTASPRHHLLTRRHLTTGELACHYCYLPDGQPASPSRPVRAAGLRWPAEEDFESGKDCSGLDQSQVRRYTAIARHTVLVMAALAVCAVTAALLRRRTGTQAPAPVLPDQPPPADPGMIPLTVPETGRLLGHPPPPGSAGHRLDRRRRHQARSRWYHQRTRLARRIEIALVR